MKIKVDQLILAGIVIIACLNITFAVYYIINGKVSVNHDEYKTLIKKADKHVTFTKAGLRRRLVNSYIAGFQECRSKSIVLPKYSNYDIMDFANKWAIDNLLEWDIKK